MKLPTTLIDLLQRLSNRLDLRSKIRLDTRLDAHLNTQTNTRSDIHQNAHQARPKRLLTLFKPTPWEDMVQTLTAEPHDAFDDRRVPRDGRHQADFQRKRATNLHVVQSNTAPAALAVLFELSLEQAVAIIRQLPGTASRGTNLDVQQRAFLRIHSHLQQTDLAHDCTDALPLLTLLASRLSDLADPAQQTLAMTLIARSTQALPQIDVVEALTMQLCRLPHPLQHRALDLIESFLHITVDIPLSHIDILLGLTDAIQSAHCRQRASTLIAEGLRNLRDEPELCAEIRRRLTLSYCAVQQNLQLQA